MHVVSEHVVKNGSGDVATNKIGTSCVVHRDISSCPVIFFKEGTPDTPLLRS